MLGLTRIFGRRGGDRCARIRCSLSAYIDGELDGIEQVRQRCQVEAHLAHCTECAELMVSWLGDSALLAVPEDAVPAAPWFKQRFVQQLAEESSRLERPNAFWPAQDGTLNLGQRVVLRALPVTVAVAGLLLGIGLRVQFPAAADSVQAERRAEERGLREFESIALTATVPRVRRSTLPETFRFDDVLRPQATLIRGGFSGERFGIDATVFAVAGESVGGGQASTAGAVRSEKDR